jgi:uncharacterized repeat protein (TIGR01451 family)
MKRMKIAVAAAVITFLVLVGASTASAFWSSSANVASTVKVASTADSCSGVTSVQNASFELPVITQPWIYVPNGGVPGWTSTDPSGIEIWQSGFNGVVAPVGDQFVELNATINGTLSQSIASTPGQILQWSLLHRGRAGVDTMQVLIGSSASNLVPIRTISDGTAAWGRYSGAYVVPAGQTSTYLAFRAISTATGDLSVGNFMDDVSFGSGPCLTAASTVSNVTTPGSTTDHIGDVVQYSTTVANIGSALSYQSVLTAPLPSSLAYEAGSLTIDGDSESDAPADDAGEYAAGAGGTGTITARLGQGATAAAGGTIAQSSSTTVTFQAVVTGAVGTIIHYTPTASYVNGLAPGWAPAPAVAADVPISVTAGADVGMTAAPSPAGLVAGVTTSSTWTFIAKNNSAIAANNVVVHVTAPVSYVSTVAPTITAGAACTIVSATTADCTIGTLTAGASKTITMKGYAAAGTPSGTLAIVANVTSTSGDPTPSNDSATGTATVTGDTTPPGKVTGLNASGTTGTQTTLKWTAATDNIGVTGYDIYRDGVLIASVGNVTSFTNTLLTPSTTYSYTVKAEDAAGNTSTAFSSAVSVTTSATFTSGVFYQVSYPGGTLCFDSSTDPAVAGSKLQLATCDDSASQKWNFLGTLNGVTATANYFFMAPDIAGTHLSWDVVGSSTASGALVDVNTVTGTGRVQMWEPVAEAGGTFHFINRNSARCLNVSNNRPSAGLQLQQATCNGSAGESFTLTGVAP